AAGSGDRYTDRTGTQAWAWARRYGPRDAPGREFLLPARALGLRDVQHSELPSSEQGQGSLRFPCPVLPEYQGTSWYRSREPMVLAGRGYHCTVFPSTYS